MESLGLTAILAILAILALVPCVLAPAAALIYLFVRGRRN